MKIFAKLFLKITKCHSQFVFFHKIIRITRLIPENRPLLQRESPLMQADFPEILYKCIFSVCDSSIYAYFAVTLDFSP